MTTYPRYVPHTTGDGKWDNNDLNAVVDHVLTGVTLSGYVAYPYSYLLREISGVYDVVDKVGNLVYGGSGDAGSVDGADVNACFEAAATAIDSTGGGTLKVQAGTYLVNPGDLDSGGVFTKGITLSGLSNINIIGEGAGTVFKSTVAKQRIFTIGDASPYVRIFNLVMDGDNVDADHYPNSADALFIFTNNSDYGMVANCILKDGLNSDAGGSYQGLGCKFLNNIVSNCEHGLVSTEAARTEIAGNHILSCNTNGILVHDTNGTIYCKVHDNIVDSCANNGIEVSDSADYNEVYNNTVISCNKGIVIDTSQNGVWGNTVKGSTDNGIELTANATRNQILANRIWANGDHGIEELSGADFNVIVDNVLKFNTGTPAIVKTGSSSTVRNNSGFITEWGSTATITAAATSIVVNHGCDFTPTYEDINICLLNVCTNDIGYWYFDTVTATQFTIHVLNAPGVSTAVFKWNVREAHTIS